MMSALHTVPRHRPWRSLYRGVPPTIEPASRTALDMFRATAQRHRDAVRWDRVDGLMDFGGIRIEDDVLVTAADPEILTAAIP